MGNALRRFVSRLLAAGWFGSSAEAGDSERLMVCSGSTEQTFSGRPAVQFNPIQQYENFHKSCFGDPITYLHLQPRPSARDLLKARIALTTQRQRRRRSPGQTYSFQRAIQQQASIRVIRGIQPLLLAQHPVAPIPRLHLIIALIARQPQLEPASPSSPTSTSCRAAPQQRCVLAGVRPDSVPRWRTGRCWTRWRCR